MALKFYSAIDWFRLPVILSLVFFLSSPVTFAQPPVLQAPDGQLSSPFAKVYEKVSPSVAKIDVQTRVDSRQQSRDDSRRQLDPFWREFFNVPEQQKEQSNRGVGSGVIVDRDGHILTNNHVIEEATEIEVTLNDDERYTAEVVGTDPETDLAVIKLKLNGKQLPAGYVAEMGDSDQVRPGDYAIAIGNPLGLDRTITVGVVSALGRSDLRIYGGGPRYQNFIQTDAQINPGNSGGALCDINGRVIGINDMYNAQFAGIGFAIPSNMAKTVMTKLIATGKVERGFLGIAGKDIDRDIQSAMALTNSEGLLVESVVSGSPAEKAGLKAGDVIVSLDGGRIKNYNDFSFKVAARNPGDTMSLDVIQGGYRKTLSVKLASRDEFANSGAQTGETPGVASWRGIHVADLNSEQYKAYIPPGVTEGVLVVQVDSDSPALDSGIAEGDVVTEIYIGGARKVIKNVSDFETLKKEQQNNSKRSMLVYRIQKLPNGQTVKGSVTVKGE